MKYFYKKFLYKIVWRSVFCVGGAGITLYFPVRYESDVLFRLNKICINWDWLSVQLLFIFLNLYCWGF